MEQCDIIVSIIFVCLIFKCINKYLKRNITNFLPLYLNGIILGDFFFFSSLCFSIGKLPFFFSLIFDLAVFFLIGG